jgi:hypothetical protein
MNCNKAQTTREGPPGTLQKYRTLQKHYNEYGNVLKRNKQQKDKTTVIAHRQWHLEPIWDSSET